MEPTDHGETISAEEISIETGLCIPSVYQGLERGEIPGRRVGKRWVVSRVRFVEWLHGRAHPERTHDEASP